MASTGESDHYLRPPPPRLRVRRRPARARRRPGPARRGAAAPWPRPCAAASEQRWRPALGQPPAPCFECAACPEVLRRPPRAPCGHAFCHSCISANLKNNVWTCPYCCTYLPSEGIPATDIAKRMESTYQNWTECERQIRLSEMRAHLRTCEKYREKYGPVQELGDAATRYSCPYCQCEVDEDELMDHCLAYHRSERRGVVMCITPFREQASLLYIGDDNAMLEVDDKQCLFRCYRTKQIGTIAPLKEYQAYYLLSRTVLLTP
ncbi:LOW QUALITY PROTEIN: E3 ubiquitin-protein ligase RNF125 [Nyctibius grandis]|uniref:LOW QUALITY PROTEIN: E3 ubiquitin-protein ligase RNF125 n=1 Tax=Nyctibius grandis TaxID=48427 RepID=UPI0035BBD4F6